MINNTAMVINDDDVEAQVPKRKKRKQRKAPIQALMTNIQFSSSLLDSFKATPAEEQIHLILNKNQCHFILKFLNANDMLAYSLTSKQAYINIHSNAQHRFTLYSEPTERTIKKGLKLLTDIEKKTNKGINLSDEFCSLHKEVTMVIISFAAILLTIPGVAFYNHTATLKDDAIRRHDSQAEAEANRQQIGAWTLMFGLPVVGFVLFVILGRHLKNKLALRLESNQQDLAFFKKFPQAIEKHEDLLLTQNTLTLFNQHYQRTESADTEKTPLLRSNNA